MEIEEEKFKTKLDEDGNITGQVTYFESRSKNGGEEAKNIKNYYATISPLNS